MTKKKASKKTTKAETSGEKVLTITARLSKKHPNNAMRLGGVMVKGYQDKEYQIPVDTKLDSPEVKAWFVISSQAVTAKADTPDEEGAPEDNQEGEETPEE